MIGYLEGRAVSERVVACHGVGYVVCTLVPLSVGEEVSLWISTQVREDSITLFGFETSDLVGVFEALVKLPGVGAQTAMSLLRDVGIPGLLGRDPKVLQRATGVGAKLATRIAAELVLPNGLNEAHEPTGARQESEIAATLEALGFPRQAASRAARAACSKHPDTDEEALIAEALRIVREEAGA